MKQLSNDLKNEFPDMGLSPRNLWNMKRFYERYYQEDTKLLQSVAVLPWGHNLLLLDKIQSPDEARFYANEVLTKGWSRDLLLNAIKMDSYSRAEKHLKTHNFSNILPEIRAEYANEVFKSTYNLGFLGITRQRVGAGKQVDSQNQGFCIGIRQRFFIYRQPIPAGIQQQRILCGYAFLS